jgi:hypothetical protein
MCQIVVAESIDAEVEVIAVVSRVAESAVNLSGLGVSKLIW